MTLSQYTAFLNAVAKTDTYNLYNTSMASDANIAGIARSGSPGSYSYSVIGSGNRPVTYVSWFDAARFANWLANGQPTGAQGNATTEDGAYSLFGATSGVGFTKNAINPNTGTTTTWWIPSENEWYKAAYYDPTKGGSGYWLYPTRSNSAPGIVVGSAPNQANFNNGFYSVTQSNSYSSGQNYLTDGGSFSASGSYYGTFDQGGNVWEWNDAVIGSYRGLRGGAWNYSDTNLQSSSRYGGAPVVESNGVGFRVARPLKKMPVHTARSAVGGTKLPQQRRPGDQPVIPSRWERNPPGQISQPPRRPGFSKSHPIARCPISPNPGRTEESPGITPGCHPA